MKRAIHYGFIKPVLLFLLCLLPCTLFASHQRSVLFLSSYHPGFPTFFQQVGGIREAFEGEPIILDIEFMDSKRFPDRENLDNFHRSLSAKLSRTDPYDAVITGDDSALLFVLAHREELFPDLPVVFMGVNDRELALEQNADPRVTGIIEAVSMKETLEVMTRFHPKVRRIVALVDGTPAGQADLKTFYRFEKDLAPVALTEISLAELSFDEFAARLNSLGEDDVALLLSAYRDRDGRAMLFDQSLEFIRESYSGPLYHLYIHGMGEGIVGGKLISHFQQGKAAAEIVLDVLAGRLIGDIPVQTESPNAYLFDYRELQRLGISSSEFPEGSTLLNRPRTQYQEHKKLLWSAFAIFCGYSLLVLGMWLNIRRRKRAERELSRGTRLQENIISNIPVHVYWKGRDSRYLGCNQRFASAVGVGAPENIVGKTDHELSWRCKEAESTRFTEQKVMAGNISLLDVEETCIDVDGRQTTLLTSKVPLEDETGMVMGILGTCADITLLKRAEATLLKTNRSLKMRGECSQLLARAKDEATFLDEICRIIVETGEYLLVWVGLAEQDQAKSVRPVAEYGFETGYLVDLKISWTDDEWGQGPTGTAIRTGKPQVCRDVLKDPRFAPWRSQAERYGYASSIALPLRVGGEPFGALNIYASQPNAFDEEEIRLLGELAHTLEYGILLLRAGVERKKAVLALRERERLLHDILDYSHAVVYLKDLEGRYLFINRHFEQLFRVSRDQVSGKTDYEFFPAELADRFHANDRSVLERDEPVEFEEVAPHDDGLHTYMSNKFPLYDAEGKVYGICGISTDITERKRAEEALLESEERFRSIFQSAAAGMATVSPDGRILQANPGFCRISGYTEEELAGMSVLEGTHPEDRKETHRLYGEILAGKRKTFDYEKRYLRKDGTLVWGHATVTGVYDANTKLRYSVNLVQDITDRKKAEEDLRASEARFRSIFATAAAGMATFTLDGKFLQVNPAMCKILGYSEAEFLDLSIQDVTHPLDRVLTRESYEKIKAGRQQVFEYEKRYLRKDGSTVWGHATVACVMDPDLKPHYCVGQLLDITDRKLAEESLHESARLKSEFVTTTAHEFRTPLTSIQGFSELLLTREDLSAAEKKEFLTYIHERSKVLARVVSDLLDISRIEAGQRLPLRRSPCTVKDLFAMVKPFLETRAASHRLEVDLAGDDTRLNIDKGKIVQVLENLVSNAIKYSPKMSLISIRGKLEPRRYLISVADRGIGMTMEQVDKVFEKFYRADASYTAVEGIGLGMSIVKEIVEAHGGEIRVESEPGKGTTVRFFLPLEAGSADNRN